MSGQFHLFGAIHLLILVSVGAMAAGLARVSGANASAAALIRYGVGALLAVNELAWYVYRLHFEGFRFPGSAAVTIVRPGGVAHGFSTLYLEPSSFETAHFAGLGGSGMALLTPDLWAVLIGLFDAIFKTNYMYLCTKPASGRY